MLSFIKHALLSILVLTSINSAMASHSKVNIKIAFTTDVHGNFFPTDFITRQPGTGSLARVASAIDSLRNTEGGRNLILLDNGDILQGQPTAYYYNYIDTVSPHLVSEIYNFMNYDATTIGNHDVETGHPVYDRWRRQNKMPLLGANVIDAKTGEPYLEPYTVIERDGIKVAVLGLLTPAIPAWLPEVLWSGLRFDDMKETAEKWIPIIKERESPDIIIGLFHSGHDENSTTGTYKENASETVAREVPGFDAVLIGHDHQRYDKVIRNVAGQKVHILNPANNARAIGVLDISVDPDEKEHSKAVSIKSEILDVCKFEPSEKFMARFATQAAEVDNFVSRIIGETTADMSSEDAFFGPSSFMTLLHRLQLEISGADISFAAPLSFNALIKEGPIRVSDMFTLYKYENMLYVMELTGKEIKDYLEESYSLWTKQITDSQPHLINFRSDHPSKRDNRLMKPSYNFDSAAGIDYTVDVTQPKGSKITISGLSDGRPFDPDKKYTVAVNSYRANGGGDLLTNGAGIPAEQLKARVVRATDKDLRYYLIKAIEKSPEIKPETNTNWQFIPAGLASKAIETDREILFSSDSSKEQK